MDFADWLEALWRDPERRAKALHMLWLASLGMLAVGYATIALHYLGRLDLVWP